jgi:hypothetical protein
MELHAEIQYVDTGIDVDEPTGPVAVRFRAPEVGPRRVNYGDRNGPVVKHNLIVSN